MVLTQKNLDDAVELLTERFKDIFNDRFTAVDSQISSLEESINNNKQEIGRQRDDINELKRANADQSSQIDELLKKLETLSFFCAYKGT